jgi:hypothetical protein
MCECIDFADTCGPVVWFEPNPREPGEPMGIFLIPLAASLEQRLEAWLANENLLRPAWERSELKRRRDEEIGEEVADHPIRPFEPRKWRDDEIPF